MLAEAVHDDVSAWAAVEDIAEDVQLIDSQSLDDVGDGDDERIGTSRGYDALDDAVEVGLFVDVRL